MGDRQLSYQNRLHGQPGLGRKRDALSARVQKAHKLGVSTQQLSRGRGEDQVWPHSGSGVLGPGSARVDPEAPGARTAVSPQAGLAAPCCPGPRVGSHWRKEGTGLQDHTQSALTAL